MLTGRLPKLRSRCSRSPSNTTSLLRNTCTHPITLRLLLHRRNLMASTKTYVEPQTIVKGHKQKEGAGFIVTRPFPSQKFDYIDPFLLLDHLGPSTYGPGEAKGAPWHPHRGFVTITYLLSGEMQHRDSMGNTGTLRAGDAQYMVAGSGIVHDEEPSDALKQKGGTIEGFQIWVNLPRKDKMIDPSYQDISRNKIPSYEADSYSIRVIAGEAMGLLGPVKTLVPIQLLDIHCKDGAELEFQVPSGFNSLAYLYRGEAKFGTKEVVGKMEEMVLMNRTETESTFRVKVTNPDGAKFLVLAGKPLEEEVARYGPFVMNTMKELQETYLDFLSGQLIKSKGKMLSEAKHDEEYDPNKATIV